MRLLARTFSMAITRHNFEGAIQRLEGSLLSEKCKFLAIDTEFTGLSATASTREHYLDTLEQRYQKIRETGQQFMVMQFGLSLALQNDAGWSIETYCFYVFPRPYESHDQRFSCQASCMVFLSENGFDFNKFISDGIPFMNTVQQEKHHKTLLKNIKAIGETSNFKKPVLTSARDKTFVAMVDKRLKKLIKGKESFLTFQERNSFHRFLIYYQCSLHSNLFTEKMENDTIRVTVVAKEQQLKKQKELEQALHQKYQSAVGFSRVIQLISQSQRPVVGHNCLLDLIYTFSQFHRPLPETLSQFKEELHALFPQLYDTKHIARTALDLEDTSLQVLYETFEDTKQWWTAPEGNEQAHDAGYDSLMTAVCFLGLSAASEQNWNLNKLVAANDVPSSCRDFANKLNLMRSDATHLDVGDVHQVHDRSNVLVVQGPEVIAKYPSFDSIFEDDHLDRVIRQPGNSWFLFFRHALPTTSLHTFEAKHPEFTLCSYNEKMEQDAKPEAQWPSCCIC